MLSGGHCDPAVGQIGPHYATWRNGGHFSQAV